MPTPAAFVEAVAVELRNHESGVADNVTLHNALYRRLKERNKIKKVSGGYEIARTLSYQQNQTYQRYSGYEALNIQASDVLTMVRYPWVQAAVNITASGLELRNNGGREGFIDLVKERVENARGTAANNMSLDLYSDGSLTNQMGGLASVLQTNGQGTVGGIDSATWTFWQNFVREIAGTNTWSKSTIRDEMQAATMRLTRGADKPDLYVATHDFYAAYWGGLTDFQRYTNESAKTGQAGFTSLKFNDADVIFDSNTNFATTGERMYMLNTKYLELVVHRQADWTQLADKVSVNQDAVVMPLIWQGQLVCTNRSLQGLLIDAA